jgi:hypothetical protein
MFDGAAASLPFRGFFFTCCSVVWFWEKHPGPGPGTQTKWASVEASAVVLATRQMFARVCSRKMMGHSKGGRPWFFAIGLFKVLI